MTQRLYIVNFCWAALLTWAWVMGYVQKVTHADVAHMWIPISALFLVGLVTTFRLAAKTTRARRQGAWYNDGKRRTARTLLIRAEHLGSIVAGLFILGIIGNAIGILSGFSGIDVNSLNTADGARQLGVQILSGASTTFGSTIVGATLALLTMGNAEILHTEMALFELEAS